MRVKNTDPPDQHTMIDDGEDRDATEKEITDLTRGLDNIPFAVWVIAVAGAAERITFYAVTGPWQNYIQNSPDDALPGALGLGQARATTIFNAFVFLSYLTPMPMAILADKWLGRYRTISLGLL
ncbi:peptide transporter ptr2 [Kalmusia sp. IMI 367209]|nr:peptide transporter ptr2 [Kalmusia sp. IMI 367209]